MISFGISCYCFGEHVATTKLKIGEIVNNFKFYQDNKSKKAGIKYFAPSGNYVPIFAANIEISDKGTFIINTGLHVFVSDDYTIVVEAAIGFLPVSHGKTEKGEFYVEMSTERETVLEKGDLVGQFLAAKIATPKKVNTKKDLTN